MTNGVEIEVQELIANLKPSVMLRYVIDYYVCIFLLSLQCL